MQKTSSWHTTWWSTLKKMIVASIAVVGYKHKHTIDDERRKIRGYYQEGNGLFPLFFKLTQVSSKQREPGSEFFSCVFYSAYWLTDLNNAWNNLFLSQKVNRAFSLHYCWVDVDLSGMEGEQAF